MPPISLQLVVLPAHTLVVIVAHVHTLVLTSTVQHRARIHSFEAKQTQMVNKHKAHQLRCPGLVSALMVVKL